MTEKRQKEILSQYMNNDIDDSIFNLSVQEIIFLYSGILEELKNKGVFIDEIDALKLAEDAGSAKAVNIVLMGRLAKYFDIDKEKWLGAIEKIVKPQFVEINKKAFELGYSS